jgi:predicted small integral membrane protein
LLGLPLLPSLQSAGETMMLRLAKVLLVAVVAFFYTLVVFNNLTDYSSNYQFVQHVLLMDSTFPGNHGMWRAVHSVLEYKIFLSASSPARWYGD